jgi:hypothetical protein
MKPPTEVVLERGKSPTTVPDPQSRHDVWLLVTRPGEPQIRKGRTSKIKMGALLEPREKLLRLLR